tara:strand:- start:365 stop:1630 length:1266 start_codon:yes stop_codon:yes gene_type:complete
MAKTKLVPGQINNKEVAGAGGLNDGNILRADGSVALRLETDEYAVADSKTIANKWYHDREKTAATGVDADVGADEAALLAASEFAVPADASLASMDASRRLKKLQYDEKDEDMFEMKAIYQGMAPNIRGVDLSTVMAAAHDNGAVGEARRADLWLRLAEFKQLLQTGFIFLEPFAGNEAGLHAQSTSEAPVGSVQVPSVATEGFDGADIDVWYRISGPVDASAAGSPSDWVKFADFWEESGYAGDGQASPITDLSLSLEILEDAGALRGAAIEHQQQAIVESVQRLTDLQNIDIDIMDVAFHVAASIDSRRGSKAEIASGATMLVGLYDSDPELGAPDPGSIRHFVNGILQPAQAYTITEDAGTYKVEITGLTLGHQVVVDYRRLLVDGGGEGHLGPYSITNYYANNQGEVDISDALATLA